MSGNNKGASLKEKLQLALNSTFKVISDDFSLNKKKDNNNKNSNSFELESLNTKNDFVKARAETDSSALKKKIFKW